MSDEKPPLKSKKFLAFMVAEVLWKIIALVVLFMGMNNDTIDVLVGGIVIAIIIIVGFVEVTYIGNQAALDRYVRVAKIVSEGGVDVQMKGLDMKKSSGKKEEPE